MKELERRSCRPAAGAPEHREEGVCRIANNPEKLKGKVHVNRQPCTPGEQKHEYEKGGGMVGLRQGRSPVSPAGVNGLTSVKSSSIHKAPHPKLLG